MPLTALERAISQQWAEKIQQLENLVSDVQAALNTEETGDALIEVARNAHRAEMELAATKRRENENV